MLTLSQCTTDQLSASVVHWRTVRWWGTRRPSTQNHTSLPLLALCRDSLMVIPIYAEFVSMRIARVQRLPMNEYAYLYSVS